MTNLNQVEYDNKTKLLNDLLTERIQVLGNCPLPYSQRMAEETLKQIDVWYGSESMTNMERTVTRPPCKECNGTGQVVYTKERGGPICNSCGGNGYLTDEIICRIIGSLIDYPSVYMGGPSHNSMRKAEKIIEALKDEGLL